MSKLRQFAKGVRLHVREAATKRLAEEGSRSEAKVMEMTARRLRAVYD